MANDTTSYPVMVTSTGSTIPQRVMEGITFYASGAANILAVRKRYNDGTLSDPIFMYTGCVVWEFPKPIQFEGQGFYYSFTGGTSRVFVF